MNRAARLLALIGIGWAGSILCVASGQEYKGMLAHEGPLPIYDQFSEPGRQANLLYLDTLAKKPWWDEGVGSLEEIRIPVLVTEPIGLDRRAAPVSLFLDLPANALPASVRVVTPYGEEVPSQVKLLKKEQNSVEIVFLIDLLAYEQVPLFVYCGPQAVGEPRYDALPAFCAHEGRDYYHLENERLRAKLDKGPGQIKSLVVAGGSGKNLLSEYNTYNAGEASIGSPGGTVEISEDGPVRKTISYVQAGVRTDYSLYPSSTMLYYRIRFDSPRPATTSIKWAPYGDCRRDHLYYESSEIITPPEIDAQKGPESFEMAGEAGKGTVGVKRCLIRYADAGDLKTYSIKDLKEGWLAYEDERGEVAGEIYELKDSGPVSLIQHATGYMVSRTQRPALEHKGGLVAARDNFELVRREYIAWKNPPLVTIGRPQSRVPIAPKVPVFGEDFIRMHYGTYPGWCGFLRTNEYTAVEAIKEVQELGGNYFGFYAYNPFWEAHIKIDRGESKVDRTFKEDTYITKELIPTAHKSGVGIEVGLNSSSGYSWPAVGACPIADKDIYLQDARGAAKAGVDMICMLDEFGVNPWADKALAKFKETFKVAPPTEDYCNNPAKLASPGCPELCLFRMQMINDILRDMCQAARAVNPKVSVFHVTSPNNLSVVSWGYHDMEAQSDFVDFTCTDLYSSDLNFVRYYTKYIRGAMGNTKPVMTVFSMYTTGGAIDFYETQLEVYLQILWGTNSLWGFSLVGKRSAGDGPKLGAKLAFNVVDYSGLGDLVVKAQPYRTVGVLRDRDAFVESIKRGEAAMGGTYEHRLVAGLLVALRNLPVDIVFSKYLPSLAKDGYRVLVIPNDPVISAANAELLEAYVNAGGNLIVEAEGLNSKLIREMAKIELKKGAERTSELWEIKGSAKPLAGLQATLRAARIPFENKGAEVLATVQDGSPAFTYAKYGQGSVIYTPFVVSAVADSNADLALMLRKLVEHQAGPPPLALDPDNGTACNILVNKEKNSVIIGAYNVTRQDQEVQFTISEKLLGLPEKCGVVELTQGEELEFADHAFTATLAPLQVRFFRLAAADQLALPEARTAPAQGPAYSNSPGMKFLKTKIAPSKTAPGARKKEKGRIYVGIFKGTKTGSLCDWGTEAIYEEVKKLNAVKAEYIEDLTERETAFYDVIIMPNRLQGTLPANSKWPDVLREFVQSGGGALMVHHAIGRNPPYPTVFPEIATCGTVCVPLTTMQVVEEHPVTTGSSYRKRFPELVDNPAFSVQMNATQFKKGETFEVGFPDYFAAIPGPEGKVVVKSVFDKAKNLGEDPTVVVGKFGKGKVVLSAMGIGCLCKMVNNQFQGEEKCTDGERKILVNSIYWLADREKED